MNKKLGETKKNGKIRIGTNLVSFVTEEMDFWKIIQVPQAVCFIPTLWKNLFLHQKLNSLLGLPIIFIKLFLNLQV